MKKERNHRPPSAIHVVGAAILRAGHCLVALRSAQMSEPNAWEFPGGKVESGEGPREALVREIREELGVAVRVGRQLGCGEVRRPDKDIRLDVYLATIESGEPVAREHEAIRWITADQIEGLCWAEADVPVLPCLAQELQKTDSVGRED